MRNCENETMRDQLPMLAHGTLAPAEAAALRAHMADCEACAAELELLTRSARLFASATPHVDVAAIVAKLPMPPAAARPALRVEQGGARTAVRTRSAVPRYAMAAAASLVLVATLSFAALKGRVFGGMAGSEIVPDTAGDVRGTSGTPGQTGSEAGTEAVNTPPVALVGGAELDGLGEQQLETLLQELDRLEATVAADPISLQRPVTTTPGGF